MNAVERILVPIDFSPCSLAALERAALLAKELNATIDALHVWPVPSFIPSGPIASETGSEALSLLDMIRDQAVQKLDALVERARSRGMPLAVARCEPGDPAQVIVEDSRRGDYDLIVIGTHGRTGFSRLVLGSVAERVVRLARCPVLSLRILDAA